MVKHPLTEGAAMPSLFEEVGGLDSISAAVDRFYERVLGDSELTGYFAGVDVAALKRHQRRFLTAALGGPNRYDGRTLRSSHAGRAITDEAFDTVAGHLSATLDELGVPEHVVTQVIEQVASLRGDVVDVPPKPPASASASAR